MPKDYRTYLQESGQQSKLSAFGPGEYEKAAAAWGKGGAGTSGTGVSTAGIDFAKKAAGEQRALLDKQRAEEQGLLSLYESAITGQERLPAMYGRISSELGIPGQQEVVGGLRNEILRIEGLLEALPEDVKQYTAGKFVTAAGQRRLEASRTEPLSMALSRTGRVQERATGTLSDLMGGLGTQMTLESAQMSKDLLPIQQKLASFGDRAAREITGYSSANQMELDAILSKISADQELTMAEQSRAHDLATLEKQYELEREALSTEVVTSGGQVRLINSKTGAVIANLGSSKTGGGGVGSTEEQRQSLKGLVESGAYVDDVVNIYADKLSLADIQKIYDESSPHGVSAESGAEWREKYRKAQQTYGVIDEEDNSDSGPY